MPAASHKRTRPYHHGSLRPALIRAGRALLPSLGVKGLTLRAVARHASVSAAAAYRHFRDVRALTEAIAAEGFAELKTALEAALHEPELAGLEPLDRIGRGYVRFALQQPDTVRLIFSSLVDAEEEDAPLVRAGRAAFQVLLEVVEAGQKAGSIAPGAPRLLALAAWSYVHGLATLMIDWRLDPQDFGAADADGLVEACQTVFRQGWGVASRPRTLTRKP